MLKVFSVKDVKADAFMQPFFTHNRNTAERDFREAVSTPDQKNPMSRHPEDFELYELGNWDDQVGVIVSRDAPDLVIKGSQVVPRADGSVEPMTPLQAALRRRGEN